MKVSVVIPVYNVKPYLERCVQSVLRQTYKDIEVILVDDGSKDGSGELCDQIALYDNRIRVIHKKNQGLSEARNTGIRQATGEYIIFFDSDDEWLVDNGLEALLEKGDTSTDLIIFKVVDIWKNDNRTYNTNYDLETISHLPHAQAVFSYLIQTQMFRMSACLLLIRRRLLIEHSIFFPIGYISEDLQWSLHLWQHARTVIFTNLDFYGYYHRSESLSTTASINAYNSYDKMFSYWKEECNKNCINASAIRIYMANLWVSRGYAYYQLTEFDKPTALSVLERHAYLLTYAATPKARRVQKLVKALGVKNTVYVLGLYWRIRKFIKKNNVV